MSSTPVLNDDQWSKLLEYVAETYNEVTLSRGFHFYKQQMVTSLLISLELRKVHAVVEEFGEKCKVTIDLTKLKSSTCTCPVGTSCKHVAAALMELADRQGYPASQIMNAKMALKRVAAQSSNVSTLEQLPGMTVEGWHKFMEHYTFHFKPSYDQGNYVELLRGQFAQLKVKSIPFTETEERYFELHQRLFILRKIVEQNAQTGVTFYTAATVYHLSDELDVWMRKAVGGACEASASSNTILSSSASSSASKEDRLSQTLTYLREQMAIESPKKLHHFRVFTTFWDGWAAVAEEPEIARLTRAEIAAFEAMDATELSLSLCAGRAYLHLRQARPSEAWEAMAAHAAFTEAPALLFTPFLSYLQDSEQWSEMVHWLRRLSSFYAGKRHYVVEDYAAYWKIAVAHLPEAEEPMWEALKELLPSSYRLIESLLYERREWKSWIEMQIVQGYDPFTHRVNVLQPIEKESPELLLPYYHQAVEHYIRLKNRHDYKAAVRLLKRLEKVYKKMKQPERWEAFFTPFVSRYSRLRALQEELKKGKLLE
ncbi:hypothetical protein A8709_16215 [Paenibacillus pectinilyticus]|uniref:SWIM-type domain-containing protein n=1 Tax=Paenibacillus pectinilyticus TaxID=512399 RepID=A0A1C1A541_9BACL|nr:SWIM zinc finger family protein [Paenibacillus pectinilyticus]OCT15610.1 hypothetical protein A8709_16215 [Paenibacillus pectinilyticus]